MNLENEQLSDLMWAMKTLFGRGDGDDSSAHAIWMLSILAVNGITENIRLKAARATALRDTRQSA